MTQTIYTHVNVNCTINTIWSTVDMRRNVNKYKKSHLDNAKLSSTDE